MRRVSALLLVLFGAGCVTAQAEPSANETYIPYASTDGIVEWEVVGDDTLYVHALTGGWYVVKTLGACGRLRTALSLGFQTSAGGELDKHGAVVAEGQRCPVASVRSAVGPPPRKKP